MNIVLSYKVIQIYFLKFKLFYGGNRESKKHLLKAKTNTNRRMYLSSSSKKN